MDANASKRTKRSLGDLSDAVHARILSFVGGRSLAAGECVSKQWCTLIRNEDWLWRQLYGKNEKKLPLIRDGMSYRVNYTVLARVRGELDAKLQHLKGRSYPEKPATSTQDSRELRDEAAKWFETNCHWIYYPLKKKVEAKEIERYSHPMWIVQETMLRKYWTDFGANQCVEDQDMQDTEFLMRGTCLVARLVDFDLDEDTHVRQKLSDICKRAREVLEMNYSQERDREGKEGKKHHLQSTLNSINTVLFEEYGYGEPANYYSIDSNLIHRVLEQRQGQPILMSLIYILIARKIGLFAWGLSTPRHFICEISTENKAQEGKTDGLGFYIDAFDKGKNYNAEELMSFFREMKVTLHEQHLEPAPIFAIFIRMMTNMTNSLNHRWQILVQYWGNRMTDFNKQKAHKFVEYIVYQKTLIESIRDILIKRLMPWTQHDRRVRKKMDRLRRTWTCMDKLHYLNELGFVASQLADREDDYN